MTCYPRRVLVRGTTCQLNVICSMPVSRWKFLLTLFVAEYCILFGFMRTCTEEIFPVVTSAVVRSSLITFSHFQSEALVLIVLSSYYLSRTKSLTTITSVDHLRGNCCSEVPLCALTCHGWTIYVTFAINLH